IAEKARLKPDTPVEVSLVDDKLLVSTIGQSLPTLAELLANVTEEYLHHEIDTVPSVGNEAW
ncbi:MAG TPA: AbrB/MazE/SpoVT family DNA-binding domain-containing protein, partial [Chloroflexota bacterium]|nr:AbrB/MazE/SpoVT family DNA-binding domain-containing protein [Chloroflexota bacterium]